MMDVFVSALQRCHVPTAGSRVCRAYYETQTAGLPRSCSKIKPRYSAVTIRERMYAEESFQEQSSVLRKPFAIERVQGAAESYFRECRKQRLDLICGRAT